MTTNEKITTLIKNKKTKHYLYWWNKNRNRENWIIQRQYARRLNYNIIRFIKVNFKVNKANPRTMGNSNGYVYVYYMQNNCLRKYRFSRLHRKALTTPILIANGLIIVIIIVFVLEQIIIHTLQMILGCMVGPIKYNLL